MALPGGKVIVGVVFMLLAGVAAIAFLAGVGIPILGEQQNAVLAFFESTLGLFGC